MTNRTSGVALADTSHSRVQVRVARPQRSPCGFLRVRVVKSPLAIARGTGGDAVAPDGRDRTGPHPGKPPQLSVHRSRHQRYGRERPRSPARPLRRGQVTSTAAASSTAGVVARPGSASASRVEASAAATSIVKSMP